MSTLVKRLSKFTQRVDSVPSVLTFGLAPILTHSSWLPWELSRVGWCCLRVEAALSRGMVRGNQVHETCVWGTLSGWRAHEGKPLLQEEALLLRGLGGQVLAAFQPKSHWGGKALA